MPVPALITDLSTTASSNSPSGGEAPTAADDYLRTLSAFIAQLNLGKVDKTGSVVPTANQPMGGYKHTGASSATASGQYLVWGQAGYLSSLDTSYVGGNQVSVALVTVTGGVAVGASAWYPLTDEAINLGGLPSYRWNTAYIKTVVTDQVATPLINYSGNLAIVSSGQVTFNHGGQTLAFGANNLYPATTLGLSLGGSSNRWNEIYAASGDYSGTVTAGTFSGAGTDLTGTAASLSIGGNAATATTAAACSGNAATATTAAACSGNAATATTAAACSGNAATATVASSTTAALTAGTGLTSTGTFNGSTARTFSIASTSNGYGTRTVSASAPSGGSDGDIWYVV